MGLTEKTELKNAGLKVTLPRVKILDILAQHEQKHFSAEAVHKALQDSGDEVGLATVYRVLTQFEDAGLVTRIHIDEGRSIFELKGEHHDHIACVRCNRIDEFVNPTIERIQKEVAKSMEYDMVDHSLCLFGEPKLDEHGACIKCGKNLKI